MRQVPGLVCSTLCSSDDEVCACERNKRKQGICGINYCGKRRLSNLFFVPFCPVGLVENGRRSQEGILVWVSFFLGKRGTRGGYWKRRPDGIVVTDDDDGDNGERSQAVATGMRSLEWPDDFLGVEGEGGVENLERQECQAKKKIGVSRKIRGRVRSRGQEGKAVFILAIAAQSKPTVTTPPPPSKMTLKWS